MMGSWEKYLTIKKLVMNVDKIKIMRSNKRVKKLSGNLRGKNLISKEFLYSTYRLAYRFSDGSWKVC